MSLFCKKERSYMYSFVKIRNTRELSIVTRRFKTSLLRKECFHFHVLLILKQFLKIQQKSNELEYLSNVIETFDSQTRLSNISIIGSLSEHDSKDRHFTCISMKRAARTSPICHIKGKVGNPKSHFLAASTSYAAAINVVSL